MTARALFKDEWRGRPYLLSPVLDFLFAGGGALLALLAVVAWVPYTKDTMDDIYAVAYMAGLFGALSYFVNMPHFMASYQLLYHGFGRRLKRLERNKEIWWRTVNAGIMIPVFLLLLLALAIGTATEGDMTWLRISVQAMFFFVGWHYCKQAFGIFMMLSALKGIFYVAWQRRLLLINAYTVWLCSWVYMSYTNQFLGPTFQRGFTGTGAGDAGYASVDMPESLRLFFLVIALTTTALSAYAVFRQWRATGKRPSFTALISYLSMYYLWAFVAVVHPEWALAAPFFHSLQYVLFVAAYKRGEMHTQIASLSGDGQASEKRLRHRAQEFFGWSFLLGLLGFIVIPFFLTAAVNHVYPDALPPRLFFLVLVIFINIHHYFIDNVIWRKENEDVGLFLMGWRKNRQY